jgi:hypothetical protein
MPVRSGCGESTYFSVVSILATPEAILTSMGFMEAAWTLMRTSLGLVICGVGSVATSYSSGLEYFGSAIARIEGGTLDAIIAG